MRFLVLATAVVIIYLLRGVLSSLSYDDKLFFANLTKDYDPLLRPVFNRSHKTMVEIGMGLTSIISLDEKRETLSCRGFFLIYWTDEILVWNLDPDKPHFLQLSAHQVWTPLVYLGNSVTDNANIISDSPVIVYNDGYVVYSDFRRTDTSCKVNIKKFPFDIQVCDIKLAVYIVYIVANMLQ